MQIDFEEKDHIYSVNGDIASISVTELLAKHRLAPDYSKVPTGKRKQSAEKGKEVHKDLENIFTIAGYEPKTEQGIEFKKWQEKHIDCGIAEQKLAFEYNGLIIAGTADVMAIMKDGSFAVGDHKNTSKFHREYVSWQVSLLDYFARKLGKEKVNGKLLNWKGATKFYCFHYTPKLEVRELDKIPDSEIEKLIDDEFNGRIYQRKELVVDPELQNKFLQAEEFLAKIELDYKQAEANAKKLREEMLSLFENQGIESWTSPTGKIKVSYVRASESIRVDSEKLKREQPQIFSKYQKLTKTKSHIRVKVGEEE